MKYILLAVLCCVFLAGCGTKQPMSYADRQLLDARNACRDDANSIADPPYNSDNPSWNAYFTMCMKTRYGYTDADLRKLWY